MSSLLQQISGKKAVPVLNSGQRGFWGGCNINYFSEKTEYTEGSSSCELDITDGGEGKNERLLVHFRGGGVWGPHPDAVFQSIAEVFVDLHSRVRRCTWQRKTVRRIRLEKEKKSWLRLKEQTNVSDFFSHKNNYLFSYLVIYLFWTEGTERGCIPNEKISQRRTPKDHTSLWLVYTLSKMLSGAIHFKGRRALTKTDQCERWALRKTEEAPAVQLMWVTW